MTEPESPAAMLMNLMARANASNQEAPLLFADQDMVDQWVLVPRAHLQMIQSWGVNIDEVDAVLMIAKILADARLLGLK